MAQEHRGRQQYGAFENLAPRLRHFCAMPDCSSVGADYLEQTLRLLQDSQLRSPLSPSDPHATAGTWPGRSRRLCWPTQVIYEFVSVRIPTTTRRHTALDLGALEG